MKQLITLIALLITMQASGQEFGSAVLIDGKEAKGKYNLYLLDQIKKSYSSKRPVYTEFYTWDGKADSQPQYYERYKEESAGSKPITTAVYLKTYFTIGENLEPTYSVDTTGKVTAMYLHYPLTIAPVYKIIDLPSSEVKESTRCKIKEKKGYSKFNVKNYKDYFGKDPRKLKPKDYRESMSRFMKEEGKKIDESVSYTHLTLPTILRV